MPVYMLDGGSGGGASATGIGDGFVYREAGDLRVAPVNGNGLVVHNRGGLSVVSLTALWPGYVQNGDGVAGFPIISGIPPIGLVGSAIGLNGNITTDQAIPLYGASKHVITAIKAWGTSAVPSGSMVGGIYTLPSKGGTQIVAASQAWTGLALPPGGLSLTVVEAFGGLDQVYLSLTVANGSAVTFNLSIYAAPLSVLPDVPL